MPDEARLRPIRKSCWTPVIEPKDGPVDSSKFSGAAALLPDETWPACPNCSKPMQLFLQLNPRDLPEGFVCPWRSGLLQFFYCVNSKPLCEVDCEAYAAFSKSTLLRIQPSEALVQSALAPEEAFPPKQIVGWKKMDDLPSWEELSNFGFSDTEAEAIAENGYPRAGDKLAGWPAWVQGIEYPNCPKCGSQMKLFFQIDSEDNLPYMFGDVGCGHITYCERHPETLAFAWACC